MTGDREEPKAASSGQRAGEPGPGPPAANSGFAAVRTSAETHLLLRNLPTRAQAGRHRRRSHGPSREPPGHAGLLVGRNWENRDALRHRVVSVSRSAREKAHSRRGLSLCTLVLLRSLSRCHRRERIQGQRDGRAGRPFVSQQDSYKNGRFCVLRKTEQNSVAPAYRVGRSPQVPETAPPHDPQRTSGIQGPGAGL